jgi:plasmid stability protein
MTHSTVHAFQHICGAINKIRYTLIADETILTELEDIAFRLCTSEENEVRACITAAMATESSRIFQAISWDRVSITEKSLSHFLDWADDQDFAHFLASKPMIGNCLPTLVSHLDSRPRLQNMLFEYIDQTPCLEPNRSKLLVDAVGLTEANTPKKARFYAEMLRRLVSANPKEAGGDLLVAHLLQATSEDISSPSEKVIIALILAGANPDTQNSNSGGSSIHTPPPSAHERLEIISTHGPLEKYIEDVVLF